MDRYVSGLKNMADPGDDTCGEYAECAGAASSQEDLQAQLTQS